MNYNMLIKKISVFLSYKKSSSHQYREIFKLLNGIKNDENMKSVYYNFMGKVLLKQGKYMEAKYYFLEHIACFPDFLSCYYSLYKIDIYEQNFIDAYLDLFHYKQYSDVKTLDITFPLAMIEVCLDLEHNFNGFINSDYSINNTSRYFYFEFEEENIKRLYDEIIECFNNRNYVLLQSKLIELNEIVVEENKPIDLNPVIKMCNYIMNKLTEINESPYLVNNVEKPNLRKVLSREKKKSSLY